MTASRTRALAVLTVATALLAGSDVASAATSVVISPEVVYIDGDDGDNRITIDWRASGQEFLVGDKAAKILAPECEALRLRLVRCDYDRKGISVFGAAGADRISLGAVPLPAAPEILGGDGRDRLFGSPQADFLCGGSGNDSIRGLGGDDSLDGEKCNLRKPALPGADVLRGGAGDDTVGSRFDPGADRSYGGPGNDLLIASDHWPDRRLAAGPGADRCRLDRRHDPKPSGCEDVRRFEAA